MLGHEFEAYGSSDEERGSEDEGEDPIFARAPRRRLNLNDYEAMLALDGDVYDPGNGLSADQLRHLVEVPYQGRKEKDECLCGEELQTGEMVKYLCCAHVFHSKCIDDWLSRQAVCPIDRKNIS
jgi:hypothetical protein